MWLLHLPQLLLDTLHAMNAVLILHKQHQRDMKGKGGCFSIILVLLKATEKKIKTSSVIILHSKTQLTCFIRTV